MSPTLCRDCLVKAPNVASGRCANCGSPRLLRHDELFDLSIAHMDCDAFFAAVEKRDDPSLRDKPVIVGGGRRGVVSTCCYLARIRGVHSAMPMYRAREACPEAVVLRPNMRKYAAVGAEIRELMREVTPLVEPLSLDEAFLDLSGTERLHHRCPAETMAALARRIERQVGISVSVGLSYCKFLAKIASDLDKPRGFAVIGKAEAKSFLADKPVSMFWGVGKALQRTLARDGFSTIGQFQDFDENELIARYGSIGRRLARFSVGHDTRRVNPNAPAKSVSAETTFDRDMHQPKDLENVLWRLSETVAQRLKKSDLAGGTVVLKLRTTDFQIRTRNRKLPDPTQLADVIFRHGKSMLAKQTDGTAFRLIGIGVTALCPGADADPGDLADPDAQRRARAERAVDQVRAKFGREAIGKGRARARKLT